MAARLKSQLLPTQNGTQARRPQAGKANGQQERSLSLDEALYNHLVLPPHLPHRQDPKLNDIENALTERLLSSVKHLQSLPNNEHSASIWESVRRGLDTTRNIHIGGHVDRTTLARELNDLGESELRALHSPVIGASVVFEAFESSARNEDILATDNALQWDFPGCAVAVPLDTFRENGFVSHLA
ncbi:unnamed protein product, partial [Fusarium langsethiae]